MSSLFFPFTPGKMRSFIVSLLYIVCFLLVCPFVLLLFLCFLASVYSLSTFPLISLLVYNVFVCLFITVTLYTSFLLSVCVCLPIYPSILLSLSPLHLSHFRVLHSMRHLTTLQRCPALFYTAGKHKAAFITAAVMN